MLNWIRLYLFSIQKDIVVLLALDMSFLLIMECVLINIPAPFPIFVKIGKLLVTLGVSFLASFIFFFVQIHIPRINERRDLFPSLATLFNRMLNDEKQLLEQLLGVSMKDITENVINKRIKMIDLYKEAPLILAGAHGEYKANYVDYSLYELERIDKSWEMIMHYSSYLDSECLSLLFRIQDSGHLLSLIRSVFLMYNKMGKRFRINQSSQSFVSFWRLIIEQQSYYNRVFAQYN